MYKTEEQRISGQKREELRAEKTAAARRAASRQYPEAPY